MVFRTNFLLALAAVALAAQEHVPVIGPFGVLHGASYQPVISPTGFVSPAGIAPGSIFIVKGGYLGPDDLVLGTAPYSLRLPDGPGGTEIRVRSLVSGEVVQARIVHAWTFQVAAIVPKDVPLGDAEAQVWYGGRASEPVPFRVVRSHPGLFSLDASGSGRGVIQNYESPAELSLNGLTRSAQPGQYVILWGTGLGDARTDEVQIRIDGRSYPVAYAGPAPGIEGVDQINLRLPEDLTARGCYARVSVAVDGVSSGQVSMALSDEGGPCQHPWGLSSERLAEIEAGDRAVYLNVTLTDGATDSEQPQPFGLSGHSVAIGQAFSLSESALERYSITRGFGNNLIPASRMTCPAGSVYSVIVIGGIFRGPIEPILEPPAPENPPIRAAGVGAPWRVAGPAGASLNLDPQSASAPAGGYFGPAILDSGFFAPGQWSVAIPGGSDLGPIDELVQMPELPEVAIPASVHLGEDFEVQWSPAQIPAGYAAKLQMRFWGENPDHPGQRQGMGFACPLAATTGRVLVELSHYTMPLVGVEEAELTFEMSATTQTAPVPGVDRFEATGTAYRTWTVPLE